MSGAMVLDLHTPRPPLFERVGGFARVSGVVMRFYDKVLDSDRLGPWFEHVDMGGLIDHQTRFVAALMGGPASYSDEMLRRAHARLGINRAAFDEMKALLADSLREHGVEPEDVEDVMAEIERCAPLILTA